LAFNHLEDYYPEGVKEFKTMIKEHNIDLPQGLSKNWTDEQVTAMAKVAYNLGHMWNHAIGSDWKDKITVDVIKGLFYRL
jgi:3-deoxy-alpha-D-manno-octulosonate 8-oxidase